MGLELQDQVLLKAHYSVQQTCEDLEMPGIRMARERVF